MIRRKRSSVRPLPTPHHTDLALGLRMALNLCIPAVLKTTAVTFMPIRGISYMNWRPELHGRLLRTLMKTSVWLPGQPMAFTPRPGRKPGAPYFVLTRKTDRLNYIPNIRDWFMASHYRKMGQKRLWLPETGMK